MKHCAPNIFAHDDGRSHDTDEDNLIHSSLWIQWVAHIVSLVIALFVPRDNSILAHHRVLSSTYVFQIIVSACQNPHYSTQFPKSTNYIVTYKLENFKQCIFLSDIHGQAISFPLQ